MRTCALVAVLLGAVVAAPVEAGLTRTKAGRSSQSSERGSALWQARRAMDALRTEMRRAQLAALRDSARAQEIKDLRARLAQANRRALLRRQELAAAAWSTPQYAQAQEAVRAHEARLSLAQAPAKPGKSTKPTEDPVKLAYELVALRGTLRAAEYAAVEADTEYQAARAEALDLRAALRSAEAALQLEVAQDPTFLAARDRLKQAQAQMRAMSVRSVRR